MKVDLKQKRIESTSICSCAKQGKNKSAGGYIWKYKEISNG
jgi:hypothetical protein